MNNYKVFSIKVSKLIFKNYTYLVVDDKTKDAVIIDPAWQFSKIDKIIIEQNINLKAILLTHSHFDHVNLIKPLVKKYNSLVYMSREEIDFYGFKSPNLRSFENFKNFKCGSLEVYPILSPGHTKGSTCYLIGNSLFTGDTLFSEGCGICHGKGACPEEMFYSIKQLKEIITNQINIFPGHSFGIEVGKNFDFIKQKNIYLNINTLNYFVEYRMRGKQKNILNFK